MRNEELGMSFRAVKIQEYETTVVIKRNNKRENKIISTFKI